MKKNINYLILIAVFTGMFVCHSMAASRDPLDIRSFIMSENNLNYFSLGWKDRVWNYAMSKKMASVDTLVLLEKTKPGYILLQELDLEGYITAELNVISSAESIFRLPRRRINVKSLRQVLESLSKQKKKRDATYLELKEKYSLKPDSMEFYVFSSYKKKGINPLSFENFMKDLQPKPSLTLTRGE